MKQILTLLALLSTPAAHAGVEVTFMNFVYQDRPQTAMTFRPIPGDVLIIENNSPIRMANLGFNTRTEFRSDHPQYQSTKTALEGIIAGLREWYRNFLVDSGRIAEADDVFQALSQPLGEELNFAYTAITGFNNVRDVDVMMAFASQDRLPVEKALKITFPTPEERPESMPTKDLPLSAWGQNPTRRQVEVTRRGRMEFKRFARGGSKGLVPWAFLFSEEALLTVQKHDGEIIVPDEYVLHCDDSMLEYYKELMLFQEYLPFSRPGDRVMQASRRSFRAGLKQQMARPHERIYPLAHAFPVHPYFLQSPNHAGQFFVVPANAAHVEMIFRAETPRLEQGARGNVELRDELQDLIDAHPVGQRLLFRGVHFNRPGEPFVRAGIRYTSDRTKFYGIDLMLPSADDGSVLLADSEVIALKQKLQLLLEHLPELAGAAPEVHQRFLLERFTENSYATCPDLSRSLRLAQGLSGSIVQAVLPF